MADARINEVLGRAAMDHDFCHRLVVDPDAATRSYKLPAPERHRLKHLLAKIVPTGAVPRKAKKASAAAAVSLATLLLSTSGAFAADEVCKECVVEPGPGPIVNPGEGAPGTAMAIEKIEIAVEKVERAALLHGYESGGDFLIDSIVRKKPGR